MKQRPRQNKIVGAFVAHSLEMRESPAWHALSDNGRRVLDRLEVEHMRHGGAENGRLGVTYTQFETSIRRQSIKRAIDECVSLGFLKVTRVGFKSSSEFKNPSEYFLTYVLNSNAKTQGLPTDQWRAIGTSDEAREALAKIPRSGVRNRHR